jgi:3-deoxy-D-manno-octulosonic-acid transferase
MYLVYEVALYLVLIVGLPFFLLRRKYTSTFAERMGHYRTAPRAHDVWIHAVSVGETLAAKPVVDAMLALRPATTIVLTTTTATGQAQAKRLFPAATVTYFPLDFSVAVKRFLDHHRPRLFAAMETEIWPNATRLAAARGMKLVLANGRISDRSFPRYRAFRPVVARVLRHYDAILAREERDAERFRAIGAPQVEVAGNVKFDYVPDERPLDFDLLALAAGRPIVVLGSTMEGEDEALLPAVLPLGAFVVVAPRKPERFDVVAGLADFARRSCALPPAPRALLLDTIGELARVYRYATAAFIGGSLVPTGGHNPIEPAAVGVPTCFGPHMTNFREIAAVFLANGAAAEVRSAAEVAAFMKRMIDDRAARHDIGERARRVVEQNRGAAERTARRIVELLA